MADPVTLTIIIVSWNVREYLQSCLTSVFRERQSLGADWQVVVVDNASSDGSAAMVKTEFPQATLIENQRNVGYGAANNQAFAMTSAPYVLLLNPDTVLIDGAIEALLARMQARPRAAIIAPRILNPDGTFQRHSAGSQPSLANLAAHFLLGGLAPLLPSALFLSAEPASEASMGWVSGACMMVRRQALGGAIFDERFFLYYEDADLCARLRQAGWDVLSTPAASVIHYNGRSFSQASPEHQLQNMQSLRSYFFAHHGLPSRLALDVVMAAGLLLRAAFWNAAALLRPTQENERRRKQFNSWFLSSLRYLRRPGLP